MRSISLKLLPLLLFPCHSLINNLQLGSALLGIKYILCAGGRLAFTIRRFLVEPSGLTFQWIFMRHECRERFIIGIKCLSDLLF